MNASEWDQIKGIVQQALERTPEQRAEFVARQCAGDASLMDEVIGFLKADQTLGDFISQPAYLSFVGDDLSDEAEDLRIGERLGRYEIAGELGRGGMGTVYLAFDDELNRKVALKILPAQLHRHPGATERFRREAHIISALNHPNVLTIHEIGRADAIDFIATEFVDGITLRQRIATGDITIREAADIASQVIAALAAAHAAGFIHRDIKPENIIIRADGLVKVLDFGIAKLHGSQDLSTASMPGNDINLSIGAGTPRYMSPEQRRGDPLDERSDIWSFGAVLFEMLIGQPPGDDRLDVISRWRGSAEVRRLVNKCLEPTLDDRYVSANEVIAGLRTIEKETAIGGASKKASFIPAHLRVAVAAAAVVVAVLSASIVYLGFFSGPQAASPPDVRNLAILPIDSVGSSVTEEYFTNGLTDGLIGDLSQIADLRVISRTSVMRYKDRQTALSQVAQELNVEAVVLATVQRSGETVRLSVKLIQASTGRPIWEAGYERPQTDLPALQKDVTRDIARAINIKLTPREDTLLSYAKPVDAEAYEEYLKGRFFLSSRNEEGLRKAISHFEESISRDPQFALSHAFLADAYFALGTEIVSALPPTEALEKGGIAAAKAVELDNSLAEAHASLGVIKLYKWHWSEAEFSFRRASELNPNYGAAHSWHALYSVSQGRVGEAIARMYKARDLDPLSPHITQNVGWMLHYAGQHQEEIEQYKRALELDPNFLFARRRLAGAYRRLGRYEEAIAECEAVIAASGRKPVSLLPLAIAYASAGRRADAETILKELISRPNIGHISSYAMATLHAALGHKSAAFERLEKAYEEKSYALVFLKVTKDFDENFRKDPRFVDLLRRLDLATSLP